MTPTQERRLARLACDLQDAIEAHDAECALKLLDLIKQQRQGQTAPDAPSTRHDARQQLAGQEHYKKP